MDEKTFKKMKEKMDENAAQIVVGVPPTAKYCQTCIFADGGTPDSNAPHKAHCAIFASPDSKPNDVLWKGAECPAYAKK